MLSAGHRRHRRRDSPPGTSRVVLHDTRPPPATDSASASTPTPGRAGPSRAHPDTETRRGLQEDTLLRKEVIQPHLPVRLPCYDFVPIASPTFDGSPPDGLGHRLRVLPTFVT